MHNRFGRELLLRYCGRPPFALERLTLLPSGHVAYQIKSPWRPDQTHRVMEGVAIAGPGLVRLAEGSADALAALRNAAEFELTLPFICADESGPKHFNRTLDAATMSELAARKPDDSAPTQGDAPQTKSFWSKLFG